LPVHSQDVLQLGATLSPASVAANTTAEQTFTLTGIRLGDAVFCTKPTAQAGLGIAGCRCSAHDVVAITFINATAGAIVPTASEASSALFARSPAERSRRDERSLRPGARRESSSTWISRNSAESRDLDIASRAFTAACCVTAASAGTSFTSRSMMPHASPSPMSPPMNTAIPPPRCSAPPSSTTAAAAYASSGS